MYKGGSGYDGLAKHHLYFSTGTANKCPSSVISNVIETARHTQLRKIPRHTEPTASVGTPRSSYPAESGSCAERHPSGAVRGPAQLCQVATPVGQCVAQHSGHCCLLVV